MRGQEERDLHITAHEDYEQTASLMAAFTLLEDETKAHLAKVYICRKHGTGGGGRVLLAHYWQRQGEEMGRILSTCQAALLLLQRISENKRIDGEILLC